MIFVIDGWPHLPVAVFQVDTWIPLKKFVYLLIYLKDQQRTSGVARGAVVVTYHPATRTRVYLLFSIKKKQFHDREVQLINVWNQL